MSLADFCCIKVWGLVWASSKHSNMSQQCIGPLALFNISLSLWVIGLFNFLIVNIYV